MGTKEGAATCCSSVESCSGVDVVAGHCDCSRCCSCSVAIDLAAVAIGTIGSNVMEMAGGVFSTGGNDDDDGGDATAADNDVRVSNDGNNE